MLWIVRGLSGIAVVAFLAIRFSNWSEAFTVGKDAHGGDLYQMVRVSDFREEMAPERSTPPIYGAAVDSTEIVMIGDSHTRFARGGQSLAAQMFARFPRLRSVAVTAIHPRFFDPSDLLRLQRIPPGQVRIVVWESAERALADVATKKLPQPFNAWDTTSKFALVQMAREVNSKWFTGSEVGYQFLLFNSVFTRWPVEAWNTLQFRITGDLRESIGAWRLEPPQLFLAEEMTRSTPPVGESPTSCLQVRDSALVEAIAANIADARDRLLRDFGAQLVVVNVPAKTSLMHSILGISYDDFLPRVNRALARHGVRSIDSWGGLSALGERGVLRTETHLAPTSYTVLADSISSAIHAILKDSPKSN